MRPGEFINLFTMRARDHGLRVDCPMGGSLNARIAFIGEAPGEYESRQKAPFVGASGKFLFDATKRSGLNRTNTYLTNVIKRQLVLSSKSDARDNIKGEELEHWRGLLWWELSHIENLEVICALGNEAIYALTGEKGVEKLVGSIFRVTSPVNGKEYVVVCNFNPAFPMREPSREVTFRFALGKVSRVAEKGFKEEEFIERINPTPAEATEYILTLREKALDLDTYVSWDIEVMGQETACIGIGGIDNDAMCINFRDQRENRWSVMDEAHVRLQLNDLILNDPEVKKTAQNGQFDAYWIALKDRIHVQRMIFDTLLAHHACFPQLPHNLGFLTMQYTDLPYYKDELKAWREGGDIDRFWRYNCKDVIVTHKATLALERDMKSAGVYDFFFDHIMKAQPRLIDMTVGGVPIDRKLKDFLAESLQLDVDSLLKEFHEAVHIATMDHDYNPLPTSPKQMRNLYFGKLRLVGRGTSVDAENRSRMLDHPSTREVDREVILAHNKYSTEQKFVSTYAKMRSDEDNRIRSEYRQFGTTSAPGRLSSAGLLTGTGANLQNQPERAQYMYALPKGYCFVYYDLSQAEARYVGWDANIEHWIEDFERARVDSSYDCHRALASQMFNTPYDEVPTKDRLDDGSVTMRFIAKRCRHGLNYRMGPDRLAITTGLPPEAANRNYSLYHRINPELRVWWDWIAEEYRTKRVLHNAYGRRLPLMQRIDDKALESIVAFRPQSTIGDKCVRVIYQCHSDPRWPTGRARMALNIHDANIAISRLEDAKLVASIMKEYAEEPITQSNWKMPLIIPADLKISYPVSWHTADDGTIDYYEDEENGLHRWGAMKELAL